jgi:hypothetical protein
MKGIRIMVSFEVTTALVRKAVKSKTPATRRPPHPLIHSSLHPRLGSAALGSGRTVRSD